MLARVYELMFYKLYRWNKLYFPSYFEIEETISSATLGALIVMNFSTVYWLIKHFLKIEYNLPMGFSWLFGMLIIGLNVYYFSRNRKYDRIISDLEGRGFNRNRLSTLLALLYFLGTIGGFVLAVIYLNKTDS